MKFTAVATTVCQDHVCQRNEGFLSDWLEKVDASMNHPSVCLESVHHFLKTLPYT